MDAFLEVRRKVGNLVAIKKINTIEIEMTKNLELKEKIVIEFEFQLHLWWQKHVLSLILFFSW